MKCVAISSGKGGVGKSTVTINLGLALAQRGKRVLLVDADLGLANLDILAGLELATGIQDAVRGAAQLQDVVVRVADGLMLLPSSSGLLRLERLSHDQRSDLATGLRGISDRFDIMLFDTGAGITENVLFFDTLADEVLLVTVPEPTAMTDTYALIKILSTQPNVGPLSLLVNRARSVAEAALTHEKLQAVCSRFLDLELTLAGSVLTDPAVEHSIRMRSPVVTSYPHSAASLDLASLAARFDSVFKAEERGLPSLRPAAPMRSAASSSARA